MILYVFKCFLIFTSHLFQQEIQNSDKEDPHYFPPAPRSPGGSGPELPWSPPVPLQGRCRAQPGRLPPCLPPSGRLLTVLPGGGPAGGAPAAPRCRRRRAQRHGPRRGEQGAGPQRGEQAAQQPLHARRGAPLRDGRGAGHGAAPGLQPPACPAHGAPRAAWREGRGGPPWRCSRPPTLARPGGGPHGGAEGAEGCPPGRWACVRLFGVLAA